MGNSTLIIDLEDVILPALGIEVVEVVGDEIVCHCPDFMGLHVHGDSTPSFAINRKKLLWNCFVCSGGTLIGLVSQMHQIDAEQARKWLEDHASSNNPMEVEDFCIEIEDVLQTKIEGDSQDVMPEYPEDMVFRFSSFHPYLSERGISIEAATTLNVGYDPRHNAIAIPHWFMGKLVGIQYRHIDQVDGKYRCPRCEKNNKRVPKYKNTANFPKNLTFYNYDRAAAHSQVIVVESPFSALKLFSQGYENVVATFGAGIPQKKAELLYRFNDGVFLWSDNDDPGKKSTRDAVVILESWVPVFIVPVVPGEKADPADLDADDVSKYLADAYSSVIFPLEGFRVGI